MSRAYEGEETTLTLIDKVAFTLLLEKGYEGTNMRKISEEVGIKAASLYFYYKSKKDIFISIYGNLFDDQINSIKNMLMINKGVSIREQLYLIFRSGIKNCINNSAPEKFILRYRIFPAEEIIYESRVIYEKAMDKEFQLLKPIFEEYIKMYLRNDNINEKYIFTQFKNFQNIMIYQMILSGLSVKDEAIQRQWDNFESDFLKENI